jgi:hypothetical protein
MTLRTGARPRPGDRPVWEKGMLMAGALAGVADRAGQGTWEKGQVWGEGRVAIEHSGLSP